MHKENTVKNILDSFTDKKKLKKNRNFEAEKTNIKNKYSRN